MTTERYIVFNSVGDHYGAMRDATAFKQSEPSESVHFRSEGVEVSVRQGMDVSDVIDAWGREYRRIKAETAEQELTLGRKGASEEYERIKGPSRPVGRCK